MAEARLGRTPSGRNGANHNTALAQRQVFDESLGTVIIPSHVFSELMNVLGKKLGHKIAVAAGQ